MRTDTHNLITGLVNDLQPIRPLSLLRGLIIVSGCIALAIWLTALLLGFRPGTSAGNPSPVFLIASGLFLMLGIAACFTVVGMSRPQVGNSHVSWFWAVAMAALLPLSAGVLGWVQDGDAFIRSAPDHGIDCLINGSLLGLIVGSALTLWLRRGAPTSPDQAGLLTGIAAGSLGIFAYSLHCPYDDILHIGLWHSLVVAASAVIGRAIIPSLIRW